MNGLTRLRPKTEAEIGMAVHEGIVVNLDRLLQLKGKGKANGEHFKKGVWLTPIELPRGHSIGCGPKG
jgi:hypothetical protein